MDVSTGRSARALVLLVLYCKIKVTCGSNALVLQQNIKLKSSCIKHKPLHDDGLFYLQRMIVSGILVEALKPKG